MLPSLFVSHGSPEIAIRNNRSTDFLKNLSSLYSEPKYILVISAHWTTSELRILSNPNPELIYDFNGFQDELYSKKYNAINDIEQVNKIVSTLKEKNISIVKDDSREGYDHGVWIALSLMYPQANIPVIQLSLPVHFSNLELLNIGEALQSLKEDTLIIGSGAMTHNISEAVRDENAPVLPYAQKFRDWVVKNIEDAKYNELLEFKAKAPYVYENHPSLEHFLPLFISLGASKNKQGKSLHNVYMHGNQSMDTIIFED